MPLDLTLLILDLDRLVRPPRRIRAYHRQAVRRLRALGDVVYLRHVRLRAVVVLAEEVELLAALHLLVEAPNNMTHLAPDDLMRRHLQILHGLYYAQLLLLAQFAVHLPADVPRRVVPALLESLDYFAPEDVGVHDGDLFLPGIILSESHRIELSKLLTVLVV